MRICLSNGGWIDDSELVVAEVNNVMRRASGQIGHAKGFPIRKARREDPKG
jgi:hypothetical protein